MVTENKREKTIEEELREWPRSSYTEQVQAVAHGREKMRKRMVRCRLMVKVVLVLALIAILSAIWFIVSK